jgi:hypothetical protein
MAKAIHNGLNRPDNCHLYKRHRIESVTADAEELKRVGDNATALISTVTKVAAAIAGVETNAREALKGAESGNVASQKVAEAIHTLTVAGNAISTFSKTISGIAFKTQLLALNASTMSWWRNCRRPRRRSANLRPRSPPPSPNRPRPCGRSASR